MGRSIDVAGVQHRDCFNNQLKFGGCRETSRQRRHGQKTAYRTRPVILARRFLSMRERILVANCFAMIRTRVPTATFGG